MTETTWDLQITPKDGPLYEALRLNGYQPFHYTLIPVPQEAGPRIITPNGNADGYMAAFVQVVGMRKELPISEADREKLAEMVAAAAMMDPQVAKGLIPTEMDLGINRQGEH